MTVNYKIIIIIVSIIALLIGFFFGRLWQRNLNVYEFFRKIYINLDNFILIISTLIIVGSICFSTIGKLESFASVAINIFGSVVFSWILTKKSSKEEFKQEQEELALRSFRHINYIESASNTAYKKIEKYLDSEVELNENAKLMLSSTMDQIKYIQGGINTCKMDWHDMLSDKEKQHYKNASENSISLDDEEYGTVDVVIPESEYNQEDA
ncbi:MAG: hypothetical protein MR324_11220 [Lachnospiraceae bacterium]|nr:hypothetical protein [Lachnospiraceae bacterium]